MHPIWAGDLFQKYANDNPICKTEKETQMYRTDFWTLWEKVMGDVSREQHLLIFNPTI